MRHGKNRNDVVAGLDHRDDFEGELDVGGNGACRYHHALRIGGGATGVVEYQHIVGLVLVELAAEGLTRKCVGIDFLAMLLPFLCQDIHVDHLAIDHLQIVDGDDGLDGGHLLGLQLLVNLVGNKEQAAVGVGGNLLDVVGSEFVQEGHGNGTIGSDGKEANGPIAAVLAA